MTAKSTCTTLKGMAPRIINFIVGMHAPIINYVLNNEVLLCFIFSYAVLVTQYYRHRIYSARKFSAMNPVTMEYASEA